MQTGKPPSRCRRQSRQPARRWRSRPDQHHNDQGDHSDGGAASAARPLASMFKLFALSALAHQIAAGRSPGIRS
jgi:hypothetical protein